MRRIERTKIAALVLTCLCFSAQPLAGEPVTLNFLVTVDRVANFGPFETVAPFSFPLSMTFDDQVTFRRQFASPGGHTIEEWVRFGPPTFSPVPYAGFQPEEQGTLSLANVQEFRDLSGGVAFPVVAAYRQYSGAGWNFTLQLHRYPALTYHDATDIGVPDLPSFIAGMRGGPLEFRYSGFFITAGGSDVAAGYEGTAVASDVAPIPDPGTWLLVGSGLAFCRKYLRRPVLASDGPRG